jgi:hypothetical protein
VLSKELKRDSDYLKKAVKKSFFLGALAILFFKEDKIILYKKEKVLL